MNKKIKKIIALTITTLTVMSTVVGCGANNSSADDGKVKVTFWAAPNPTQVKFWSDMAEEFESKNPDVDVEVTQMKETPSSEATIQSAIASGTAPTLSENINRSFAAQLAESEAILPLNNIEGYEKIISGRHMEKTVETWKFSDGNQYVIPMYSNPMLFGWNTELLKEIGIDSVPKTYSEVIEATKKLKEKYPDKALWAKADLANTEGWMRWFDFFMLYNAASEGGNFVEDNKFVADDKAGESVLNFISDLQKENAILTQETTEPFENGISLMSDVGTWSFPNWAEKYPDLKYNENYTMAMPPVPDELKDSQGYTYSDAKGIAMYASATEEQQKAATKFLSFVFSDEKNDLEFLKVTNLIPARDDLATNDKFNAFFEENKMLKPYAEAVPYGIPAMDNAKYNEIQQKLGEAAWVPVVKGEKTAKDAWKDLKTAEAEVLK